VSSNQNFASERLLKVEPSASVVVSQTARKLRAEGKDIIDLGIGEPDFNFSAMMATLNPGDEVLLCAPFFGSYRDAVLSIGATTKTLPCHPQDNFRLTPETVIAVR